MGYYFGKGAGGFDIDRDITDLLKRQRVQSIPEEPEEPEPSPGGGAPLPYCEGGVPARKLSTGGIECPEGFSPVRYRDGNIRCCPEEGTTPGGRRPKDGPGATGDTCVGGYRLADNPIAAGGGTLWQDEVIRPEHGWYRDPRAAGHWLWHKDFGYQHRSDVVNYLQGGATLTRNEGGACAKGYQPENINGEMWCCPVQGGGGGGGGGGEGELGWWEFPEEMQEFYRNLLSRGQKFLNMPLGYTPEMISSWFGKDYDVIRGQEAPLRQQTMATLGREGMLGTGAVPEAMGRTAWDIESKIADLSRDIFLASEYQKKQDILNYSKAAQEIFGTGMGYNQLIEAINAARRGERQEAINALLAWLGMFMWR